MNEVKIFDCDSYDYKKVLEVMNNIVTSFGLSNKLHKGLRVVIKANLVSAMNPEKNATTNPILLKALTEILVNKGCTVVIGDSPSGLYNASYLKHIYNVTKIDTTGAELNYDFNVKNVIYNDAQVLKSFEYTKYLDNADLKINFSKLKTHGMMKMSCSVKNLFGVIPGTTKPQYHYRFPNPKDFANMLIDINEYFKFDLNIVDAIEAMEGNGPTMGITKEVGLILASKNPYSLDYVCSKIIGLNPFDVETVNQSYKRNLFDYKNIKTNKNLDDLIIKNFKYNTNESSLEFYRDSNNLFLKFIAFISKKLFSTKPYCITRKCIGCKKCYNICPARAISMINNKPVIDRNKCIKCFCCQEFCPKGAMVVKKSFVTRIFKRKH